MQRPNFIFIAVDSVRASALGLYGNPLCLTPHLDRLASRGVAVRDAFCQMPKCCPSRSLMLTGRYPHVDGMRAIRGMAVPQERTDHFVIKTGDSSALHELRRHGYSLCHKGVNHIATPDFYRTFESQTDLVKLDACRRFGDSEASRILRNGFYGGRMPDETPLSQSRDAECTRQFCEFLRSHDGSDPFFAYLDLRAPHPPYLEYPIYRDHYERSVVKKPERCALQEAPVVEQWYRTVYDLESLSDEQWVGIRRAYYSAISYVDALIGEVLAVVEARQLQQNTVLVFTSDHGDFAGEHGCVEKHDTLLYDSLVRLPFLISFPALLPEGAMRETMMEQIDIAPTLLELAGIRPPDSMHGRSLLPCLLQSHCEHKNVVFAQGGVERATIDRSVAERTVLEEFFRSSTVVRKQQVILDHPDFLMRSKMVRTKTHKLIYRLNGHHELYDLTEDPGELLNVIDDPAYLEVRLALTERLVTWLVETEPSSPELAYAYA